MKKAIITSVSLFLFIACSVTTHLSHAQAAKSIYMELGGPGIASFNFDTRFTDSEKGFGGRIGVGGFQIDDVGAAFFPVAVNYLLGKDDRNYFEIGAGATFSTVGVDDNIEDEDNDPFTSTFGHLHFGYRLQPADGGFTFRAGMTPIFGKGYFIPYYASLAFGYKF